MSQALDRDRLGELRRENFEDDRPVERALGGHEDARHPTASRLTLDPVAGGLSRSKPRSLP
jgi:hypothetical protein